MNDKTCNLHNCNSSTALHYLGVKGNRLEQTYPSSYQGRIDV
jgi:hypothetical protein